ncbi:TspO/MBR family protein [Caldisalinibacter kiritimatiensis]|uniref:Tryptophan-rich possible sensory protein n=1 Tax=Caldisalinibacter kiritimatiensis TaxID=1304284 RepID=R1AWG9_9FIRM|nr:TspO/MBR family protein [Caldisalinibacter kiritimatiensis]EOD01493.1 Tryptophan-rich possible sensory protein [Caldisalinibacter kiritimatiensis]
MKLFKVNGKKNYLALIIAIAIPLLVGFLSSYLVRDGYQTFETLNKPFFAPPAGIFAPVWTILYILMGIASYRIWMLPQVKKSLRLYGIQLFFNFLWSIIFFGLALRGLAFLEIIVLLILIIATTKSFFKLDKISGYLLIPYVIWVSFASLLNLSVWLMNR